MFDPFMLILQCRESVSSLSVLHLGVFFFQSFSSLLFRHIVDGVAELWRWFCFFCSFLPLRFDYVFPWDFLCWCVLNRHPDVCGTFLHAFCDDTVFAANENSASFTDCHFITIMFIGVVTPKPRAPPRGRPPALCFFHFSHKEKLCHELASRHQLHFDRYFRIVLVCQGCTQSKASERPG